MSARLSQEKIEAKHGAFQEIPLIDFADAYSKDLEKRQKVAQTIYDACVRVGFFYIKNHGVPQSILTNVFTAAKQFFVLPLEDKMAIDRNKNVHLRGYTKLMVCHVSIPELNRRAKTLIQIQEVMFMKGLTSVCHVRRFLLLILNAQMRMLTSGPDNWVNLSKKQLWNITTPLRHWEES